MQATPDHYMTGTGVLIQAGVGYRFAVGKPSAGGAYVTDPGIRYRPGTHVTGKACEATPVLLRFHTENVRICAYLIIVEER